MARIRSIHPGLWTDEKFVSVSPMARLLFMGIWNECDDAGSFEWSPLKLKMRLLPADNADVVSLLAELEGVGCIMKYEIDGREYGAVRNFVQFQRPKKPNQTYPQTEEVRKWCGEKQSSVPNQFPTASEIAPQMEDGGDNMEDGEDSSVKDRSEKETDVAGRAKRARQQEYAFCGTVIRLTENDFRQWRETYHAIPDFRAELTSLDAWYSDQDQAKQAKWFRGVSGALNRKHQEILAEKAAAAGPRIPL